jgi:DNA-binding MarR family transcriptional regulator
MEIYVPVVREFAARVVLFHEAVAQKAGLHLTDVKALRLLGEKEMTAGQLAELIGLTGASTTALVDRLESAGYATRERDKKDRRRVTIRAKPSKIRTLNDLYKAMGIEMSRLLGTYDAVEFAAITDYMTKAAKLLAEQAKGLRQTPTKEAPGSKAPRKSTVKRNRRVS